MGDFSVTEVTAHVAIMSQSPCRPLYFIGLLKQ